MVAAAAAQAEEEEGDGSEDAGDGKANAAARLPTGNRAFLSFYAALLCDVVALSPRAADPGPQGLAATLLPWLAQGLAAETASADYRAATLMVVTALAARCALGSEFLAGELFLGFGFPFIPRRLFFVWTRQRGGGGSGASRPSLFFECVCERARAPWKKPFFFVPATDALSSV
jgi:hypothetical protein